MLFGMAEASAATPTPQQLEQFKKLPKAQQATLAKQYGIDIDALNNQSQTSKEVNDFDVISVLHTEVRFLFQQPDIQAKILPRLVYIIKAGLFPRTLSFV